MRGIKELLFFHNYLVLPNFGGFVLKAGASHFSGSGSIIIPPSKTVSFNAQLKQNDSVLAIWLQTELHCSADESLNHLRDFTEFCSAILTTRRRLSLDGIGFFYLDFENNISFEPQNDANFLTSSFGLAPLQLKVLEPERVETKTETVFVDRTVTTPKVADTLKVKRNYQRMVTPIVLSALLFTLLFIFVSNNKISGPIKASILGSESKGYYQPLVYSDLNLKTSETEKTAYVADANGVATVKLDEKALAVKAIENNVSSTSSKKSLRRYRKSNSTNRFEIVLGCFTVRENANKMADKIAAQRVDVFVSDINEKGMYVVSSGTYITKDEAISDLVALKSKFPKAWIKNP